MLAYFAMMLAEKHRTCRSIFVGVVALYRTGLRGYHGYAAITCRSYCVGVRRYHATLLLFLTSLCISRSFLVGVRAYDGTLFLHYLIDCKYFVINS